MKRRFHIAYNAPVVLTFVLLCLAVTVLGTVTDQVSTRLLFSVYRASPTDPLTYLRLFLHVLGHSGFDHFMGNAMYLLLVGPMLEEKYGSAAVLEVIVSTAFVTGVIHCLLWGNSALCGASGVVFAFILLSSFTSFRDGEIPLTAIAVAILFLGREVFSGLTVRDNISNLTHILGGVLGAISGYSLNKGRKRT